MQEEIVKEFMYNQFIPALHEVLSRGDKEKYAKWNGNCCRQTAIYGAYMLEKFLPSYNWKVWCGEMDDIVNGKEVHYDHAWIFGSDGNKRLLVDLARNYRERLFMEVKTNSYPKDNEEYKNMVITSREQLDWKKMLKEDNEYYTGLKGEEIINQITGIIRNNVEKI